MPDIIAVIVLIAALVLWVRSVQRFLLALDKNINNAMSQIDIQLASQWKLLSELLESIRGYVVYGGPELTEGIRTKQYVSTGSKPEDIEKQKKTIADMVKAIMASAETCPELKDNPDYIRFINAVSQYEKMIVTSSLIYNESATRLNRAIRIFPSSLIAGLLGFSKRALLKEVDDGS